MRNIWIKHFGSQKYRSQLENPNSLSEDCMNLQISKILWMPGEIQTISSQKEIHLEVTSSTFLTCSSFFSPLLPCFYLCILPAVRSDPPPGVEKDTFFLLLHPPLPQNNNSNPKRVPVILCMWLSAQPLDQTRILSEGCWLRSHPSTARNF